MPARRLPEDGRTWAWGRRVRRTAGAVRLRAGFTIPAMAVAGIAMLVLSCGDDSVGPTTPPTPPPPPAPVATTVTVNPGSAAFTALGETARFAAEVRDQNGQVMAGAAVAWASSDASVATADASGEVTAAGNGTATITARAGSASGTAEVTVAQEVDAVAVSPAAATLVAFGDTVRLTAEATDANGHGVAGLDISWSSSDVGVARVDDTGLVEAVDEGTATIMAEAGDASGAAEITTVENLDRSALVALYEATDGPNWVNSDNWLTDAPMGEWYGVETDDSGRVVRLDLGGKWEGRTQTPHGLQGPLPPELGDLTKLEVLDLWVNGLTGTIPPELGNLANLRVLSLGLNRLIGVIPLELGRLANLERLQLNDNGLMGTIPADLGLLANLRILDLEQNELTGSIPPELGDLTNLRTLKLRWNSLTGPIPPWLGDLSELIDLTLGENDLTGPIPPELGKLAELVRLLLDENNLTGPIPPELGNLDDLRFLFLYGNSLTGSLPPELGNLANLEGLSVWGNGLSGPIPPQLGNLANLTSLNLSGNNFSGPVPAELGNLERLERISLSDNLLTGSIPPSFTALRNLETLGCRRTEGVCLPATDAFREWARQIEARGNYSDPVDIPFCDEIDKETLRALYEAVSGPGWTRSDGWLEDENLDRWHGVRTDTAGRVAGLDLNGNGLSGHLPEALGRLVNLRELQIRDNALGGQLPRSLVGLALEEFDYTGTSLCVADDVAYRQWLGGIPRHSGTGVQCSPLTEREILELLYRNTEGRWWRQRTGWLTDAPLEEWYGVDTDAAGQVIGLQLGYNRLSGSIPAELGQLSELRILDLNGNDLSGSIPPELGDFAFLEELSLFSNGLRGSIPAELGELSALRVLELGRNLLSGSIPPDLGGLDRLESLDLQRNRLGGEIPQEFGRLVSLSGLNLGGNFLSGPVPPELGSLSGLVSLDLEGNQLSGGIPSELAELGMIESIGLADNQLTGRIPPTLGTLSRLTVLNLSGNILTGPIPAELGGLVNLRELRVSDNDLSGSIPPKLGDLAALSVLDLANNGLSGQLPAELGDLASLVTLHLGDNKLSGPLPAGLGLATSLERLDVRSNAFAGPVPPEFAHLTLMNSLILTDNRDLAGPLPTDIASLTRLELLMAGGTGLCRPADARFDAWFGAIVDRYLARCREGPDVYLAQTVQSWGDPVPLLAGEPALLRVFVTAAQAGTATMPDVHATFFIDGAERHSVQIAATTQPIPSDVVEGNLALSANAEIPAEVIVPGLEMVIEVDPEGTLDSATGVTRRIPEEGRMAVDVRAVPPFHLTLIPILSETNPDSSVVESVSAMAADPEGHELLRDAVTLLPVADVAVSTRPAVSVSIPNARTILAQVEAMRIMEGGSGYWMGLWDGNVKPGSSVPAAIGVAYLGRPASVSVRRASTIAHELGHNLSLLHAPCGSPALVDPWFPHSDGGIGAWGFDFERNTLVPPYIPDNMSYCRYSGYWISDYFFNKALNHRLANHSSTAASITGEADPVPSLLVWGGRDEEGVPYLDPAFVVDAAPSLPPAGGDYTIDGAAADGTPLFSFAFGMPDIGDADGEEASFVFALPVQAGWADQVASITLSGPGGSVTLDESTNRPMAILRDPQTGQVRGFLSDLPPATLAATVGQTVEPGMEVLFSRGIPDEEAWRR